MPPTQQQSQPVQARSAPENKNVKILALVIGAALIALVIIGIVRPGLLRRVFTGLVPFGQSSMLAAGSGSTTAASPGSLRFVWGVSGVGESNNNEADGVAVDNAGNVYASGVFNGMINIGGGLLTLTSRGEGDIFVLKFDKTGKLLWHKQFGGSGNDNTFDIDLDPSGNIVLNGWFAGTADFGGITLTSQGSQDQFLMKMSSAGDVLWAKDFGGPGGDGGNEVTVDKSGAIFATALSKGTFTAGSFTLGNHGARDSYVMKVSSAGDVLWVRGTEGSGNERIRAIGVDSAGNVYGGYEFSGEFKAGSAVYQGTGGLEGAIVKWDANGNQLWSGSVQSAGSDDVRGITAGPAGSFYVTGFYGAGANVFGRTLASEGGSDNYLAKFTSDHRLEWMMTLGSGADEGGGEVDSDGAGTVVYSTDAGPGMTIQLNGAIVQSLSPGNKQQALLLRIDPSGAILSISAPSASMQSSGNTLGVSESGAHIAQIINFWDTLTYGSQTYTAVQKYKSFLIAEFSSDPEVSTTLTQDVTPPASTLGGVSSADIQQQKTGLLKKLIELLKSWLSSLAGRGSGAAPGEPPLPAAPRPVGSLLIEANMEEAFSYSTARNGASVLVYENGLLVGEDYENGFKKDEAHILASGTKSFSGVILAALIHDGYVASFDTKVSDVITEWQHDPKYPAKAEVTLRELLSLSSGLQPGDPNDRRLTYAEAIALPLPASNVGKFQYGPAPDQVFGEFAKRVVAPHGYTDAADYFTKRVLAPAGISIAQWNGASKGEPSMAGGVSMTAEEWAKFGEFMRTSGNVAGKQIVRADLLAEITKPSPNYAGYGMTWWLSADTSNVGKRIPDPNIKIPGDGYDAVGAKNQRLYVMPAYGIVVQRFGDGGEWDDTEFLNLLLGR